MSTTVKIKPTRPQFDVIASRQQVNLFLAGQGSGKTHCAGLVSGILINHCPKVHGFIGANTYTQLSDSTLFRIRKVWKEVFGWTEWSKQNPRGCYVVDIKPPATFNTVDHEYDSYHGKICFKRGTVIYKGSLDNYKAHDGKEFAWAILDETKDTKEEAVKEVITGRLREPGMYVDASGSLVDTSNDGNGQMHKPFNPLYIFSSPAKVQWINEWFRLDDYVDDIVSKIYSADTYFSRRIDNKLAVISSALHNSENLPANYISNQMQNLNSSLQGKLIYGDPFSQSGGEFYKCFVRSVHVRDVTKIEGFNTNGTAYNPDLPIHLTFDFNVSPYMTACVWQISGKRAIKIDELCLTHPNNRTENVCREFIRRFPGHDAGLFIYGDPAGKHEDTRSEKGHNDYIVIIRTLQQYKPSLRLHSKAPPVVMRGNFINTIFEKNFGGIEIIIHDKCTESIGEYNYLKEASDGTKLKEKVKDPETGISYEKWGHISDADDYFLTMAFAAEFAKYMKSGGGEGKMKQGKSISKNTY